MLEKAQAELVDWNGSGMSVMEMSHRGPEFISILAKTEADMRELIGIPENYKVLFVQGGASTQFTAIPMNLCAEKKGADYVTTGAWGKKAVQEAARFVDAQTVASSKDTNFSSIPDVSSWEMRDDAAYVHICANETIGGVEYKSTPDLGDKVLVADMSSNFCSKPIDVEKYGVIYAGAQKNIGPAGVTMVIVREDLVGNAMEGTPAMLDWSTAAENDSCYNTPPCWAIYMCGLVFEDLLAQGGLEAIEKKNIAKAMKLYDAINNSDGFYSCPVDEACRSLMNVPFRVVPNELEKDFLAGAAEAGLTQLKGHRSVGGIRASIYNAMPAEGVDALVAFMEEFKAKHS